MKKSADYLEFQFHAGTTKKAQIEKKSIAFHRALDYILIVNS